METRSISSSEPGGGASASVGTRSRLERLRQIGERDFPSPGNQHGPLDGMLELADIAGPAMCEEPAIAFRVDRLDVAPVLRAEPVKEALGQERRCRRSAPGAAAATR